MPDKTKATEEWVWVVTNGMGGDVDSVYVTRQGAQERATKLNDVSKGMRMAWTVVLTELER